MTREEVIERLNRCREILEITSHMDSQNRKAFDIVFQALKQEPCEDCISRQAMLEWCGDINMDVYTNEVKEYVLSLPSVNPQQKTGHWIDVEDLDGALWHACSECGETEFYATDYCHNCGIKMQGEKNERRKSN
jgi:hypothetical protein